jgi:hypothetical protein
MAVVPAGWLLGLLILPLRGMGRRDEPAFQATHSERLGTPHVAVWAWL